jgi:ABC-type sugar transport system substrate-binding protein
MSERRTVVLALLSARQEFQQLQEAEARAVASRERLDLQVVHTENDPAAQIGQLETFLRQPLETRPVAFVVEAVSAVGFERIARSALASRVGWVIVSARSPYLETLRRDFPGALVTSATIDDMEIGRIQGKQLLTLLPRGGKVLYIEGPSVSAATMFRRRLAEQELKGSQVQFVRCLAADWTTPGAEWAVSSWLGMDEGRDAQFDVVCAQNDDMALGARAALAANRPDWSGPILGCDGAPTVGQRHVREGALRATVVKLPTAGAGVELVAKSLRGEPIPSHVVLQCRSMPDLAELASAVGPAPGT